MVTPGGVADFLGFDEIANVLPSCEEVNKLVGSLEPMSLKLSPTQLLLLSGVFF